MKASGEGDALHERAHSVLALQTRYSVLPGTDMSGKSFRVSDGDWICPDKK